VGEAVMETLFSSKCVHSTLIQNLRRETDMNSKDRSQKHIIAIHHYLMEAIDVVEISKEQNVE
jgi:hypothetical protein